MAQDIRKMMENATKKATLPQGHETRFSERLDKAFHTPQKPSFLWWKVAATAVLFVGLSYFGHQQLTPKEEVKTVSAEPATKDRPQPQQISLGDLSPDLKKVEDYYLSGINLQLASLKITPDNNPIIEGYMEQLHQLDIEYERLNGELNEMGPTEATVMALIDNLKMRLDLLFKLKNKLQELKNQENEKFSVQA